MLSGLSTDQRGTCQRATFCNAANDISDALGHNLAGCNVVGHEQGLSTGDNDVINHHAHQILADSVVDIELLRDSNLSAHTVG